MSRILHRMYPKQTFNERMADGTIHLVGIVVSIVATILLVILAVYSESNTSVIAVSVYGGAVILSFLASTAYHFTPWEWLREPLRRVDHASIYLKIAGTYTPLMILLGSVIGYISLGFIWGLALCGAFGKLIFQNWPAKLSLGMYLTLGWISVLFLWPLAQVIPGQALLFMALGGTLYSVGAYFFSFERLNFQYAIWHGFVLSATLCFFMAVGVSLTA